MEPVIIQAALSGSLTTRDTTPHVPISVEETIEAALSSWAAGASILHLHARDEEGQPTQRPDRFAAIVTGIREAGCDAILNLTTSSAVGRAHGAARYECLRLRPEMGSFDCGSINFDDRVFENSMPFLREMAEEFHSRGVKPEIECFDVGQIGNALRLRDEGLLREPLHFQFVLGIRGGAPATVEQALYMRSLVPHNATWSVCALGRAQLPLNMLCLITGGHVRTGLEDNVYYHKGELAESNAQLVGRIVRIARELGRPVAMPDEAREILCLRSGTAAPVSGA